MKLIVLMAGMIAMARTAPTPVAEPEAFFLPGPLAIPSLTGVALVDGLLLGKVALLKAAILANLLLNNGNESEEVADSYGAPAAAYGAPEPHYAQEPHYAAPQHYEAAEPSYAAPSYAAPSYEAPHYEEPAAPSYSAPTYSAPSYEAPAAPSYEAPAAPSYEAPAAPAYNAPVEVDTYGAPAANPVDTYGSPAADPVSVDTYGSPAADPVPTYSYSYRF